MVVDADRTFPPFPSRLGRLRVRAARDDDIFDFSTVARKYVFLLLYHLVGKSFDNARPLSASCFCGNES